jgi:hypothetical protein
MRPARMPALRRGRPLAVVGGRGRGPSYRQGLADDRRGPGDPDRRRQVLEDARQAPVGARLGRPVDQGQHRGQGDQDQQQPAVADPGGPPRPDPQPAPPRSAAASPSDPVTDAHSWRVGRFAGFLDAASCPIARSCRHHQEEDPTREVMRCAGYRVNVDPGDSIVLRDLGLPDLGLFGPDLNAHLETPALTRLGFTGVNPWDRTRAAKLAAGTWRYQYEDVTTATGISAARLEGVRSWIDAPYHRLPLLDANTRHVGCAATERQTGVPVSFNRCQEHPTPFGGRCDPARPTQPVGYVVTIQADGYHAMKIQGIAFSKGSARAPVDLHRAVRSRTTRSTVPSSAYDANLPATPPCSPPRPPWPPGPPTTSASPATSRPPRAALGPVPHPSLVVHHRLIPLPGSSA